MKAMIHFLLNQIISPTLLIISILGLVLVFDVCSVLSDESQTPFTRYMLEWREKSSIAQDYLHKGEQQLKAGQKYRACVNQRLASKFGVEAFEALIKAQEYDDSDKELVNIEESLDTWRKLGKCNSPNSLFY
tara:strand:- start:461 stop:856 length:396 start_codon:yes stop_codon:yes gene_type:complete